MTNSDSGDNFPGQRRSVLTPEGQIEQAGRFARGLKQRDSRRRKLLLMLLLVVCLPAAAVLIVGGIAWLIELS